MVISHTVSVLCSLLHMYCICTQQAAQRASCRLVYGALGGLDKEARSGGRGNKQIGERARGKRRETNRKLEKKCDTKPYKVQS